MSPETGAKTLEYYMSLPYKVEMAHDEDGWFAKVIDLPGCMTWAGTLEDLEFMIEDAKRGWIEDALEYGDSVPEPRTVGDFSGKVNLRMSKSLHRDLARQAEEEGVSLNQLMVSHLARGVGGGTPVAKVAADSSTEHEETTRQAEGARQEEVLRPDQILSRDWPEEVQRVLAEYEELLDDDITPLAGSRIATDTSNLVVEFSNELTAISERVVELSKMLIADTKKRRYRPRRLKELETAFRNLSKEFERLGPYFWQLEEFASRAIEEFDERFGEEPDQESAPESDLEAYSAVREARSILEREREKQEASLGDGPLSE